MTEEVVTISKFKATCPALLDRVKRTGKPILVTRRGEAIAKIIPLPELDRPLRWLGALMSSGEIIGEIVAPASDESEWEALKA